MKTKQKVILRERDVVKQVRDYLKFMQTFYRVYFVRNHQTLGSDKGRSDFEVLLPPLDRRFTSGLFIAIEVKSPKWKGRLDRYKLNHKQRIENAGGIWITVTDIKQLDKLFREFGFIKHTLF